MASPLQNPVVVAGLLVAGVCYGLYSFVPKDWLERLEGAKKPVLPPPLKVVSPDSLGPKNRFFTARPKAAPSQSSLLMQKEAFRWDLFYETPKLGINREPKALPATWKLTGIYLDENQNPAVRAAVVSGDILKIGSKKGEFVVEEITAESVIFSHPTGKQVLSFSRETPDKKKAKK